MQAFRAASRPLTAAAVRPTAFAVARPQRIAALPVRFAHSAAESYEDFNARYADFFANAQDLFELQRGLNNCFAYDLVPSQRGKYPTLSFYSGWGVTREEAGGDTGRGEESKGKLSKPQGKASRH
ncbi:hypothetical protein JCM16303_000111 [Sporobolomyces ruberrimus]